MPPPPSLLWWAGWLANRLPPRLALRGWMQSIGWMVRFYLSETNALSFASKRCIGLLKRFALSLLTT
jgi:hypothetical protein